MFTVRRLIFALALVLSPAVLSVSAGAATLFHTWVSATGNNSGNCAISSPCRDFLTAYGNTAAGGEITCLSSGDFANTSANLIIEKSITIDCEGALGSPVTVAGGASLQFVAVETSPGAVVILRGLDFDGLNQGVCGSGGAMIAFNGAGVLHIEKSKINHAGSGCNGIYLQANGGAAELDVSDSDITDNATVGTAGGIYIRPNSGSTAQVFIDHSHINNNDFGIIADGTLGGTVSGVVKDSVVSGNAQNGITVSSTGTSVVLMVDGTVVSSNNNHGLTAGGSNAGMLVRNTSVFNNSGGGLFTTNSGALYSYGNNSVNGNNGHDGSFTATVGLQ